MTTASPGPTRRQIEILAVFERYSRERGYPPSIRALGALLGLTSVSTVHAHLNALCDKGYLERTGDRHAAYRVRRSGEAVNAFHHDIDADVKMRELAAFLDARYPGVRAAGEHPVDAAMRLLDPERA